MANNSTEVYKLRVRPELIHVQESKDKNLLDPSHENIMHTHACQTLCIIILMGSYQPDSKEGAMEWFFFFSHEPIARAARLIKQWIDKAALPEHSRRR